MALFQKSRAKTTRQIDGTGHVHIQQHFEFGGKIGFPKFARQQVGPRIVDDGIARSRFEALFFERFAGPLIDDIGTEYVRLPAVLSHLLGHGFGPHHGLSTGNHHVALAAAHLRAIARPMPLDEPVTTILCPESDAKLMSGSVTGQAQN